MSRRRRGKLGVRRAGLVLRMVGRILTHTTRGGGSSMSKAVENLEAAQKRDMRLPLGNESILTRMEEIRGSGNTPDFEGLHGRELLSLYSYEP